MHKYSGGSGGGSFSGQGKGNRTRARQEVYTEVNPMNDGQEGRNRVTALSELKVRKWKSDLPATYCSFLLEWSLGWHYVVLSEVAQLCPTLWDPVDCSPPDSSIHGILQARILEWVAISFSLEEGMATHSSILAWRISWTEDPGGLQSTGSQRVGHN